MPRIIVTADSSQEPGDASVLLDEQVQSVHLSTGHAASQLVERLAWAISDAESVEYNQPGARAELPRLRHATSRRARASRGRGARGTVRA